MCWGVAYSQERDQYILNNEDGDLLSIKGDERISKPAPRKLKSKTKGLFFGNYYVIPIYDAYVDRKVIYFRFYNIDTLEPTGIEYEFAYNDKYCMSVTQAGDNLLVLDPTEGKLCIFEGTELKKTIYYSQEQYFANFNGSLDKIISCSFQGSIYEIDIGSASGSEVFYESDAKVVKVYGSIGGKFNAIVTENTLIVR